MLPTGLNIGSTNGTIWGTPTVIIVGELCVIWANNSVGSAIPLTLQSTRKLTPSITTQWIWI